MKFLILLPSTVDIIVTRQEPRNQDFVGDMKMVMSQGERLEEIQMKSDYMVASAVFPLAIADANTVRAAVVDRLTRDLPSGESFYVMIVADHEGPYTLRDALIVAMDDAASDRKAAICHTLLTVRRSGHHIAMVKLRWSMDDNDREAWSVENVDAGDTFRVEL